MAAQRECLGRWNPLWTLRKELEAASEAADRTMDGRRSHWIDFDGQLGWLVLIDQDVLITGLRTIYNVRNLLHVAL